MTDDETLEDSAGTALRPSYGWQTRCAASLSQALVQDPRAVWGLECGMDHQDASYRQLFPGPRTLAVTLVLALALTPPVRAETWRWQDAEGNTAFGDTPPPGVPAVRLDVQTQPPADPATAGATSQRLEQAASRLAEERRQREAQAHATRTRSAQEAEARRRTCEEAQQALIALTAERPVYRDGEGHFRIKRQPRFGDVYEGPREYLDDAARTAEIARQQQRIDSSCEDDFDAAERARVEEAMLHADTCERAAADLAAQGTRPDPERQRMLEHFLREECQP